MRSLLHDTTNITSVDCTTLHFNLIYKLLFLRFLAVIRLLEILHPSYIIHTEYIYLYTHIDLNEYIRTTYIRVLR